MGRVYYSRGNKWCGESGFLATGGAGATSNSAGSAATQLPGSIARGAEGAGSVAAAAGNRAANAAKSR